MHQKKSEVQIRKDSSGVSSDFNPSPPLFFPSSSIHQKHQASSTAHQQLCIPPRPHPSLSGIVGTGEPLRQHEPITPPGLISTPHKRPLVSQITKLSSSGLCKSPTLSAIHHHYSYSRPTSLNSHTPPWFSVSPATRAAAFRFAHSIRHLHTHLLLALLLSLPFFYFLVSHPSHYFLLDFVSAVAFSVALLFSLNLALPRLPSIRLFLARSFPIKLLASSSSSNASEPSLPVFWSIGSRARTKKTVNSGCWVQVYSNGDVYEGEFHKGKCSGSGVYYYNMSGRYEGDWVDGKYDGHGVETWARGSRYRGQYKQGLRHGYGVYRFYTGDVYAGEWSNGQSHGSGVHTCEDGSRYVGEFKWGVKHGFGHYHFRNGDAYGGEYFADKMHGFGVYCFANGHRYEGSWHEGRRQGLGMYSFRNGETQSGHWENGIIDVQSTHASSSPISPVAVYHSKVLNAVQEARAVMKKANETGKVDDRVNRALSSANKAASAARVSSVKAVQNQIHLDNNPNTTVT